MKIKNLLAVAGFLPKLLFLVFICNKGYSQCDIRTTYDKFTKVTKKTLNQSLRIDNKISTAYISLSLYVGGSLDFNVYVQETFLEKEEIYNFSQITILFTDGSTFNIGDEYDLLYLNPGVVNHKAQIIALKTKKVEAIRLYKNGINYDYDLPSNLQDYFIKNIPCLFN